jgi:hypothetical protein
MRNSRFFAPRNRYIKFHKNLLARVRMLQKLNQRRSVYRSRLNIISSPNKTDLNLFRAAVIPQKVTDAQEVLHEKVSSHRQLGLGFFQEVQA